MAAVVGEAELVDLDHAFGANRAFPPGHRSGEHAVDVGVGLLGKPSHVAEHRGNRQVWFQVVVAVRWLGEGGFGGRCDIWIWVGRGSCCTFRREWRAGVPQGIRPGTGVPFMPFILRVECHGDAPQHRLALIDIRGGRLAAARADQVLEPPAALQSVIDCGDQRRPPRAGLDGLASRSPGPACTAPSRNSASNFLRFSGMTLLIVDASTVRGEPQRTVPHPGHEQCFTGTKGSSRIEVCALPTGKGTQLSIMVRHAGSRRIVRKAQRTVSRSRLAAGLRSAFRQCD